jgi:uncharacterized membrane protein
MRLSKNQILSIRFLLGGLLLMLTAYHWAAIGSLRWNGLLVGGGGLWIIDDAMARRETTLGKMIIPSNKDDPSIGNGSLRHMAFGVGIVMYLTGLAVVAEFPL